MVQVEDISPSMGVQNCWHPVKPAAPGISQQKGAVVILCLGTFTQTAALWVGKSTAQSPYAVLAGDPGTGAPTVGAGHAVPKGVHLPDGPRKRLL